MKGLRSLFLFTFLLSLIIVSAQEEQNYNIYGLKYDMRGHVGMDVGILKANNVYTGIQGKISCDNKNREFYMNCVYGRGCNFLFNSKFIVAGIIGVYTNDFFETINIKTVNMGCGFTMLKAGIGIGCSYTNRELFSVKIAFYPGKW
jgi:hypothetical protein